MSDRIDDFPVLARASHAAHCKRCLTGLPVSSTQLDASRLVIVFYCINSLDLLGLLHDKTTAADREMWRQWIWQQYTSGLYGSGFRPSPYMKTEYPSETNTKYDTPHVIMTYAAMVSLAILRDDFKRLDRANLINFLRTCQRKDGSFSTTPGGGETDLRTLYCVFAICKMLDDWSAVDISSAITFLASCRTQEGGYGQSPFCEAHGGTTYIAIASLHLIPDAIRTSEGALTLAERESTIRWLLQNQEPCGGFRGRTGKEADACYCFWCGATLEILGAKELVNTPALTLFISSCQYKYGGFSKEPGEHADPYHTYLSLATLSMYSPSWDSADVRAGSWKFVKLDPLLNAGEETSQWAKEHVPEKQRKG
ncbi:hypothetical protein AX17_006298 [Amanita inopinata Kibby_2008]|nr:hypothetical protein AX17_006298 [Amanita inopinata Kibby_2008]